MPALKKPVDAPSPCPLPESLAQFEASAMKLPRKSRNQSEATFESAANSRARAIARAQAAQRADFCVVAVGSPESWKHSAWEADQQKKEALRLIQGEPQMKPFALAEWQVWPEQASLRGIENSSTQMASKVARGLAQSAHWSPGAQLVFELEFAVSPLAAQWREWHATARPGADFAQRKALAWVWMIENRRQIGRREKSDLPCELDAWIEALAQKEPQAAQEMTRAAVELMLERRRASWPDPTDSEPLTREQQALGGLRDTAQAVAQAMAAALQKAGVATTPQSLLPACASELKQLFAQRKATISAARKKLRGISQAEKERQTAASAERQAALAAERDDGLSEEDILARVELAVLAAKNLDAKAIEWLGKEGGLFGARWVQRPAGSASRETALDRWATAAGGAKDAQVAKAKRAFEALAAAGFDFLADARQIGAASVFARGARLVAANEPSNWFPGIARDTQTLMGAQAVRACREDGMSLPSAQALLEAAQKTAQGQAPRAAPFFEGAKAAFEAWALRAEMDMAKNREAEQKSLFGGDAEAVEKNAESERNRAPAGKKAPRL